MSKDPPESARPDGRRDPTPCHDSRSLAGKPNEKGQLGREH